MAEVDVVSAELPGAPSLAVRTALPAAALAREGVRLRPLTLFSAAEAPRFSRAGLAGKATMTRAARRRLLAQLDTRDAGTVTLVHRRADLHPSLALERGAADGHRLVYDVDDAIWLDAARSSGAHPLAALKGSRRKARWLAERADCVIAGNAVLAEHLALFSSDVSVVPSLVDTDSVPVRAHAQGGDLTLGWIGSHSTARFLALVRKALARAAAELTDVEVRLSTVGGPAPAVAGAAVESEGWSEAGQRDLLARVDIGLMPLTDTPWNRGKCAYKALQYMAAGVPVVADDVGIAREVIGGGGLVVHGADEWTEALVSLGRDASLRARLGEEGRRRVERGYSVHRWAPALAALLKGD